MAIQAKVTANLNAQRQQALAEMLAEEPLATAGGLAAAAIEVMYRAWLGAGRDLKRVLSQRSPQCHTAGGTA